MSSGRYGGVVVDFASAPEAVVRVDPSSLGKTERTGSTRAAARIRSNLVEAPVGRALEMLDRVDMSARTEHVPATLSGGEQQRVAVARAFASRPSVLFADEPTGNLDTATGQRIIELLFDLNKEFATTLILVTHDDRLAQRCDRIIELAGGRVVA